MLEKRGSVLDAARTVSRLMREKKIDGVVIGGISVVLHGSVRTTKDVDVLVRQPLGDLGRVLEQAGATLNAVNKEFLLNEVPVHLVPEEMAIPAPRETVELEGVLTVGLADLINLKLHSGMKNVARAQDIADVVGLIRERGLTSAFAAKVEKSVRSEFKKLVKAVIAK